MCIYPAPECEPIEPENVPPDNETAQDNATSEDEEDDSDLDSYYTESSVGMRSESESDGESASGHQSDGESASGHRVTPDMVLLLMLKEHGAITNEEYAEKAEKCEKSFRSLIPPLPRSNSSDTLDYTKDLSEGEDTDDESDENNARDDAATDTDNDGTVTTSKVSEPDITNDKKDSTFIKSLCDFKEIGENEHRKYLEHEINAMNMQCSKEQSLEQEHNLREGNVHGDKKEYVELEEKKQYFQALEAKQKETNEIQKQVENMNENKQHENNIVPEEDATNKNEQKDRIKQEIVLVKSGEKSKSDNQDSANENNLASVEVNRIDTDNPSVHKSEQDIMLIMPVEESNSDKPNTEMECELMQNLEVEDNIIEKNNNGSHNTTEQDNISKILYEEFTTVIEELILKNYIPREEEEDRIWIDGYGEDYATHLLSLADRVDCCYRNNTVTRLSDDDGDDESEDEDDQDLRDFAIFLNFYSPSSYKYILEYYNTRLPELKVLYSWYLKDDHYPGLTEKAFKILKEKCSIKKQTCSLMLIDVFLKNYGRYCDQVDYGQGEYFDCEDKAVLAYIFVLVSLDEDWKMPIGYIFARNVPAETQAEYIRICLTHCFDAGVDVVAVTLETPTPAEFLGCSFEDIRNLKTTFKPVACPEVWHRASQKICFPRKLLNLNSSDSQHAFTNIACFATMEPTIQRFL